MANIAQAKLPNLDNLAQNMLNEIIDLTPV